MAQPTTTSKQILTSILLPLNQIDPTAQSTSQVLQSQTPNHLQTPSAFLINTLPAPQSQILKITLQTLHFLFPHELLPALDLIDRHLLTHLTTLPSTATTTTTTASSTSPTPHSSPEIYLVQSASSTTSKKTISSRFRNALREGTVYEVRLDAWNCSCPAFAYSWLKLSSRDRSQDGHRDRGQDQGHEAGEWEWLVGGTATRDGTVVPVCKHILAVVLVKAAPGVFGGGITKREVSREEMAGWAAGWGEHL